MPDANGNPTPEELAAQNTIAETPAGTEPAATSALGGPEAPTMNLELSDQTPKLEEGFDRMDEITEGSQEDIKNVDVAPTPEYTPVDAEGLLGESGMKEGNSYITPEGTVAGQLESLLDSDSAYMTNAKRRADEKAASLGLLGSSMAVGASERAAVESALPIAQADAKTYATAQLAEQKAYNEMSQKKAESDLSGAAREHIYDIDVAKAKTNASFQMIMDNAKMQGQMAMETTMQQIKSQWEAETTAAVKTLESQLTMMVEQQKISASERQYASTQSSNIMAAAYGTINDLMGNADFMAGYADDPEKLTGVFNNFIDLAKNQVEFIGATAGLGDSYFEGGGYADLIGTWTTDLGGYVAPE